MAEPARISFPIRKRARASGALALQEPEAFPLFVLDIEVAGQEVLVYGTTEQGVSAVMRVAEFSFSFFVEAPRGREHTPYFSAEVRGSSTCHVQFMPSVSSLCETAPTLEQGMMPSSLSHPACSPLQALACVREAVVNGTEFSCDTVQRKPFVGYQKAGLRDMLKISLPVGKSPTQVVSAFEKVLRCAQSRCQWIAEDVTLTIRCRIDLDRGVTVYEAQVDAVTRFSLDTGIRCGLWLHVTRPGSPVPPRSARISNCSVEFEAVWDADTGQVSPTTHSRPCQTPCERCHRPQVLIPSVGADARAVCHGLEDPHWSRLPVLKVLSLSIMRSPSTVPPANWVEGISPDPIRWIAVVTTHESGSGRRARQKFVLLNEGGLTPGGESPRDGPWTTLPSPTERELLLAFQRFVLAQDPDVLTGFEVGEALRVLHARAGALKLKGFGVFSRRRDERVSVKTMQTYTAKWAKTKTRISATTNQESTEVRLYKPIPSILLC
jgi:hypothetical protein